MFKLNVGSADRIVRIVVGVALLAAFFLTGEMKNYWLLIGIIPLATGLLRTCPLYSIFGMNTCPMSSKK